MTLAAARAWALAFIALGITLSAASCLFMDDGSVAIELGGFRVGPFALALRSRCCSPSGGSTAGGGRRGGPPMHDVAVRAEVVTQCRPEHGQPADSVSAAERGQFHAIDGDARTHGSSAILLAPPGASPHEGECGGSSQGAERFSDGCGSLLGRRSATSQRVVKVVQVESKQAGRFDRLTAPCRDCSCAGP